MSDQRFTSPGEHRREDLDLLLREWHEQNRADAEAGKERLLARLAAGRQDQRKSHEQRESARDEMRRLLTINLLRRIIMHRFTRYAASFLVLVTMLALLFPLQTSQTYAAENVLMLPEGGQLDAFDEHGESIGPCPLKQTDVDVQISGHFSRVTVNQTYHNPYDRKIEAVYTFPLSHRGAVDRMTMTIGDRVIEGKVKERAVARRMYEAAREQGYVASLLEQQRPNIFSQSVANIEPGEVIEITISYVEVLESIDGEYRFEFPMVVAPRYIPGRDISETLTLPEGLAARRGVILQGPAEFGGWCGTPQRRMVDLDADATLGRQRLAHLLSGAIPIDQPSAKWWGDARQPQVLHHFTAKYATGAQEFGMLHDDGTGQLNGRWFFYDAKSLKEGGGFSPDTDQVPDASKVTPMPVRPEKRAGHDIGVSVTIDTGGPGLRDFSSPQHELTREVLAENDGGEPTRMSFRLKNDREIPNRDFVLRWRHTGESINEAAFTHTGEYGDSAGGFFTFVLQPPDRVKVEDVRPREIIFVLDNSGSMRGRQAQLAGGQSALTAAKEVITSAIDTMRPNDRFNVISFNNSLDVLWNEPQANTEENRLHAQQYVDRRQGGGGTEMRNAVLKALNAGQFARPGDRPQWIAPLDLLNQPADGREVKVAMPMDDLRVGGRTGDYVIIDDERNLHLDLSPHHLQGMLSKGVMIRATGEWTIRDGRRVLIVKQAEQAPLDDDGVESPDDEEMMRIVLFVTDGLVGNDDAIIDAIRENARRTRVFTIGMSSSPNRHLLDEMARAGRGAADYVLPQDDVAPIVRRFAERIATPVLTDVSLEFSDELAVYDVLPGLDRLPDLFDVQPLVIHGRYDPEKAGRGTLTLRGRTGAGRYERAIELELPGEQPDHDVIATLWARAMVDERKRADDRGGMIALGETFQIMTEHTSFVAVEKARVTVGGQPMLVRVPIEFPEGMSWEGVFGEDGPERLERMRQVERWPTLSLRRSKEHRAPSRSRTREQGRDLRRQRELRDESRGIRFSGAGLAESESGGGGGGGGGTFGSPGRQLRLESPPPAPPEQEPPSDGDGDAQTVSRPEMESLLEGLRGLPEQTRAVLHRLDRDLLELLARSDESDRTHYRLLLAVGLTDLDDATLRALEELGFTIEDRVDRGTFIVGRLTLDTLEALARHDAVRRIELIRLEQVDAADE